jgi:hypothetical protein
MQDQQGHDVILPVLLRVLPVLLDITAEDVYLLVMVYEHERLV